MIYNTENYLGKTILNSHKDELIYKYIDGKSLRELSKLYNYNIATIRNFLHRCGVKTRGVKESVKKFYKPYTLVIDNFLHENMLGWLLGDGGMRIAKNRINPYFNYSDKKYEHILYVQNILSTYNIQSFIGSRDNGVYSLQSKSYPEFHYYYNLFYGYEGLNEHKQKRKILPNIDITPIILKNWFIGDGSSSKQSSSYNHKGTISCKHKNEYILQQFRELFGNVKCYYNKYGYGYYQYHFNNTSLKLLLNYIGECPVESYKYKWITKIKFMATDKTCPQCGAEGLIYEEGCLKCMSCGYSKCG